MDFLAIHNKKGDSRSPQGRGKEGNGVAKRRGVGAESVLQKPVIRLWNSFVLLARGSDHCSQSIVNSAGKSGEVERESQGKGGTPIKRKKRVLVKDNSSINHGKFLPYRSQIMRSRRRKGPGGTECVSGFIYQGKNASSQYKSQDGVKVAVGEKRKKHFAAAKKAERMGWLGGGGGGFGFLGGVGVVFWGGGVWGWGVEVTWGG